jgi:hypothetical protein
MKNLSELSICDRIRHEIKNGKIPVYRLAKEAGVAPHRLYCLIADPELKLSITSAEKILRVLGLQLTEVRNRHAIMRRERMSAK